MNTTINTNKGAETSAKTALRYSTAILDAPWPTGQRGTLGAGRHYPLMTIEQIRGLPIPDLMAENAHLYMWCYPATRALAEEIMRGWGFEFKDEFVWGKDQMGLGQYFRHAHETLLLGVKGKLTFRFHGQRSFAMLPRQDHSHKPEEVHIMIQRCSPGPYLELFARRPFPGWHVWGNEVTSDIRVLGYPVPSDARFEEVADV
ncbi:MT-A70 family methyltransferase [Microbacterium sp.]|uniref:MT-A70 family methyltransferase n=1 Tax=Microbacterium sp. TaxID=51671 RepID=UPI00261B3766|nr:MT-A70 family methyltransferase [Microbacterium sp.]